MNIQNFIYGKHAVIAAIIAEKREIFGLFLSQNMYEQIQSESPEAKQKIKELSRHDLVYIKHKNELSSMFNPNKGKNNHGNHHKIIDQEIFLTCSEINQPSLNEFFANIDENDVNIADLPSPLIILDQVVDPQNLGSIFRSAAAFDCKAIIQQDRNAAPISPIVTRISAGTSEMVPNIRVTNLSRTIEYLRRVGYFVIGMDGNANSNINNFKNHSPIVLLFGSEEKGIRKLVREKCDDICAISIHNQVESINVAHSVSIALYTITNYGNKI